MTPINPALTLNKNNNIKTPYLFIILLLYPLKPYFFKSLANQQKEIILPDNPKIKEEIGEYMKRKISPINTP